MEADSHNRTPGNGLPTRSRAEVLRGLLVERLSAAGQDICAAVETTCAGYEQEASALREQNERQRRMLTVLLQPEVKLEAVESVDFPPACKPAGGGRGGRGRRGRRGRRAPGPPDDEGQQNANEQSVTLNPP